MEFFRQAAFNKGHTSRQYNYGPYQKENVAIDQALDLINISLTQAGKFELRLI